ncbi:hypothetical protein [Flavobacterium sp.]|uniref:hypothetical protein n=1 Tax=Flavobacterium sp. TaxID=239 RepID=UPI00286E3413|nr:hypothetical protein [Flavobacterium sp.]
MKQKLMRLLLTFITGFFLYGCQDDFEHTQDPTTQKQNIALKEYSLDQANKIPQFRIANRKALNELRKSRKSNKTSSRETGDYIAIDAATVKEISFDDFTSYTMLVKKETDSQDYFENLVVHVKQDTITEAFLMKYTPTQPPVYDEATKSYTLVGNIEMSALVTTFFGEGGVDYDEGGPGGSGWTTCAWVLMCNGTNGGGIGPEHRATPYCQHKYLKQMCSLNIQISSGCGTSPDNGDTPTGNGPGGSGTGNGSNNITTSNPITTPVIPREPTPCEKVADLLDPTKANIKQEIVDLQETIPPTGGGEDGTVFGRNTDGSYRMPVKQSSSIAHATIKVDLQPTTYSYAHTHPNTHYAMFSTGDLVSLLGVADNATVENKKQVSIILVAKDDALMNVTYAITIDNIEAFRTKLNEMIRAVPLPIPYRNDARIEWLDNALGGKFESDDNNLERVFLKYFAGFNISLLKANSELTEWTKLSMAELDSQSSPSIVIPTPCNQN